MSRKLVSFDWAMKKILRQKANFGILEGFLSELFKFDVKIQEILESESNQETENDTFNRVDLLAKNENGELILIEVQHQSELDYFQRMLYGVSKLICEHRKKIESDEEIKEFPNYRYIDVKKIYSVNLLYFAFAKGRDYLYYGKTEFRGMNQSDEILELSELQKKNLKVNDIYEIFPEYYVIRINKFDDIVKNKIDEWIYFLKNEVIKDKFKAQGLDNAKEALDVLKLGTKARAVYNRREENKMHKNSLLYTAKVEGEARGEKRGKIEGARERDIEIAKNLLDVLDIETIALKTGLSIEEIKNLKDEK